MDWLQQLGKVALGSRLRRLGDCFTLDAAEIYKLYGVELQPKWFPVFCLLSNGDDMAITVMARQIGCSHPVVCQVVKEMSRAGLVEDVKSRTDARVRAVHLTQKGLAIVPMLDRQMQDVEAAVERLIGEMQINFWAALEEMEYLLDERSMLGRVREVRREREAALVEIIDYEAAYAAAFEQLNRAWIEKYLELEQDDLYLLQHPQETILAPGGAILLARYKGEIVGTVALLRQEDGNFELAKLTVAEGLRGLNIGKLLAQAALERARQMGATIVHLESNSRLRTALNLYQKLGFKRVMGKPSSSALCNIHMELKLNKPNNLE